MSKPIIISVEGNIGSGKSTILEKLEGFMRDNNRIVFLKEPVDIWESIKDSNTGENILQKFYKDQYTYAFPFQVMAYASRLSMIRNTIKNRNDIDIIICERSLAADKHIFAKMLYDDGKIDDISYQIYNNFYNMFEEEFKLDGIIYIDADAEICSERINKRSRAGESGISLEYLQKCKSYHHEWLTNTKTNVLNINANVNVTYNISDPNDLGSEWLYKIRNFVSILTPNKKKPCALSWS
jgi:deoxyadenosine/deoxycytidine kinase